MNERQAYALAHPLAGFADERTVGALTAYRQRGDGTLLTTILAIDR